MSFRIPRLFSRGRSIPPADQRRARLGQALRVAVASTRYARDYDTAPAALEELPRIELFDFLCHTERYTVSGVKPRRGRLHYPMGAVPRTAVIAHHVEETRRVRFFSSLAADDLASFAPQALAAPLDILRHQGAGNSPIGPLRNAVIAFTGFLEGTLTPDDGDRLWRRFQVPIFEQLLGFDGELLAWECELHHGLHVSETAAHFEGVEDDRLLVSFLENARLPVLRLETGLSGRVIADPCPCGDAAPRLVDLRRRPHWKMAGAAAACAFAVG